MKNTTDITNLSDAALDVVLSVRSGEDFVDCSHLTAAERLQVTEALNCEKNARTMSWVAGEQTAAPKGKAVHTFDAEGAVLDRQDAFYDGE